MYAEPRRRATSVTVANAATAVAPSKESNIDTLAMEMYHCLLCCCWPKARANPTHTSTQFGPTGETFQLDALVGARTCAINE